MTTFLHVVDALGWTLLLLGCLLSVLAALGLLRFPDLLTRMHAAAKPQVLGVMLVGAGAAMVLRDTSATMLLLLVVLVQLLTVPVSGHMLGRASYRAGQLRRDLLAVDDLSEDAERPTGPDR